MLSTESVWDRRNTLDEIISDRAYNLTIGAVVFYGFFINALMVQYIPQEVALKILFLGGSQWPFFIIYMVSFVIGTMIYTKSDNPAVSFLGYQFYVIPLGVFLVGILPMYESAVIARALLATASVTGIMMMLGAAYPRFFFSISRTIGLAMISAFVVEFGLILITGKSPPLFDWIWVVLISGYIGYCWARAQAIPKTLDNAVDSAAYLYYLIVVMFIRMLSIFGRR